MSKFTRDEWIALALMLAVDVGGCFLPHLLPNWYRVMVVVVAAMIWMVLMSRSGAKAPNGPADRLERRKTAPGEP